MKAWVRKVIGRLGGALLLLSCGPLIYAAIGSTSLSGDWRTAPRDPSGIAPDPGQTKEAVIQAYSARAFNWRGIFAVHTWIVTKETDAAQYTVHQVIGWRRYRNLAVRVAEKDYPDRSWYGNRPEVLIDIRGPAAVELIPRIEAAAEGYPYAREYRLWPGPNSNTFVAWIARRVPELGLELPVTAIGKDYLGLALFDRAPSGTGYQFSLLGLLGVIAARAEGLEMNLLGLSFGLDPLGPALKIPGIGRLGMKR
ncbi:MAG: DUF3750 domain-containing protein [Gammaproteobacteria bacterium]